jgi:hypothetical protein
VSYGSGPHLPTKVGSGTAMYPIVPDLASQLRWTLALPHVLWLQTSLPAEVGSGAAMCLTVLDLASQLRWASVLPQVLWL